MSIFGGKEVYLFSNVSGKLTYENKPASNTTVRRLVEVDGKHYEDTVQTDSEGLFSFEALTKKDRAILPKEFVSHQKLIAEHDAKDILIWETVKRSEEENAELEGKPLNFTCELTDETRFIHMMLHSIGTNCSWDN
ncbi:transthyretin-like family protein [Microbulbifer sp. CAU 1566]|uniref:transthyretin-like family protein n=1 Tax=Microbulbifer sp. CAU 1566 TaxID=2933269 RepID=UPI002002DEF4|nr:transthyretin-like family protein [Microbulbifer sp. CAU 1566]MCK7598883.1 transthyretin-like family protein [Microbulbifer sp. CAU 1566]